MKRRLSCGLTSNNSIPFKGSSELADLMQVCLECSVNAPFKFLQSGDLNWLFTNYSS